MAITLEKILRHDRWIVVICLSFVCGLAWLYLLNGAGMGMSPLAMTSFTLIPYRTAGMSMNMPEMGMLMGTWSGQQWLITLLMWWIMMIAMMLPSAAPMVLLHARVVRHAQRLSPLQVPSASFVGGYILVWLLFSVLATVLQWALQQQDWLSMNMATSNGWLSATFLILAGGYQLSTIKQVCLKFCSSPAAFIAQHMQPGNWGALSLGVRHGLFCLGCCWLLMLLLFVGGVMNLLWIAVLSLFVWIEKFLPAWPMLPRLAGIGLIIWGLTILIFVIRSV